MSVTLIGSTALTDNLSQTVTFNSIPATYNDLVLICSVRHTNTGSTVSSLQLRLNNASTTSYTEHYFVGYSSGAGSTNGASTASTSMTIKDMMNGSAAATNLFGTIFIHIPFYAKTNFYRIVQAWGAAPSESANGGVGHAGGAYTSGTAVSRIDLFPEASYFFQSGSSFKLYGIS